MLCESTICVEELTLVGTSQKFDVHAVRFLGTPALCRIAIAINAAMDI
jgi:hypothetical protein